MFEQVLFPTDFSEWSRRTEQHLPEIPGLVEVLVVHVLEERDGDIPIWSSSEVLPSPAEQDRARLEGTVMRLKARGLQVSGRLLEMQEDISTTLLRTANEERSSLIVMGARKRGRVEGLLLGRVSSRVLRQADTHVLITQFPDEEERPLFHRVLFPVDFSRPSRITLDLLTRLTGLTELLLLHVIPPGNEETFSEADAELSEMTRLLKDAGIRARRLIAYGRPSEEIGRIAEQEEVSLILMPRFGRTDYIRNILLGQTSAEVVRRTHRSVLVLFPHFRLEVRSRELRKEEFDLAEEIWLSYHQLKADPARDRIFGVFVEGILVSVARCRHHPDGQEVDGVYTREEFRGRGYARKVVQALVDECGSEPLFMHSTLELVDFYRDFGFLPIPEEELPPSILERFDFALGNLEGANVCPMRRSPGEG